MTILGELAAAVRILVLGVSAPVLGGVLLVAIARLAGARWTGVAPEPLALRLLVPGVAALGVAQLATPAPAHLALWMHPAMVGVRAVFAAGALAYAGARLASGASAAFAAATLALYALLVTPLASDWMLGHVPGHAVSAAGMMLCVEQIAGAGALVLASGRGDARTRRDMAALTIAAALGLGYLVYVDYLILWFGNLPARVGFYVVRAAWPAAGLAWFALLAGLAAPIVLLAWRGASGQRAAGASVLLGLLAFNGWWAGGGAIALALGSAAAAGIAGIAAWRWGRRA